MLFLVTFAPGGLGLGLWGGIKLWLRRVVVFHEDRIEVLGGLGRRRCPLATTKIALHPPTVSDAVYTAALVAGALTHHVPEGVRKSWLAELRGPFGKVELDLDHFERSGELLEAFRKLAPPDFHGRSDRPEGVDPIFGSVEISASGWRADAAFPGAAGRIAVTGPGALGETQRRRFLEIRAKWGELLPKVHEPLRKRASELYEIAALAERLELCDLRIEPDGQHWTAQFCYRHVGGDTDDTGLFVHWEGDKPAGEIELVD